jgi:hypothetical protein
MTEDLRPLTIREYDQAQTALYRWIEFENMSGREVNRDTQKDIMSELHQSIVSRTEEDQAKIDIMSPADQFNTTRARSRLTGDPNVGGPMMESGEFRAFAHPA